MWGLDDDGKFQFSETTKSCSRDVWNKIMDVKKQSVGDIILSELKHIHTSLMKELQFISDPLKSDSEKGKHLLFLFQCDLLPGIRGQLVESKGSRDNTRQKTVNKYVKAFCWILLILFDMAMIYYILLFALNQTEHQQDGNKSYNKLLFNVLLL